MTIGTNTTSKENTVVAAELDCPNGNFSKGSELPETLIEKQAKHYLKRHPWHLSFPPELDQYYLEQTYSDRVRHLERFLLVGVFIYGLYIVVDYYLLGDNLIKAAVIRFLAAVPFMLLATYMYSRKGMLKGPESALVLGSIIIAMSVLWIENMATPEAMNIYNTGTMVVVLYCNIVLQQRFVSALVTSTVILVIALINRIIVLEGDLHLSLAIADHVAIVGLSLLANHMINLAQSRSFLRALLLEQKARELELLATSDSLTGLYNRRFFSSALDQAINRSLRHQTPVSLLFIDVDYFKLYNDFYGHNAGDECLVVLVRQIEKALRKEDVFSRHGGEEFTVLLEDTDCETALSVVDRIQEEVANLARPHQKSAVSDYVTISIGICTQFAGTTEIDPTSLLNNADKALYSAKTTGRNRAFVYEHTS